MPRLRSTFIVSVMLGAAFVLILAAASRATRLQVHPLVPGIWISEQVQLDDIGKLKQQGFAAIIDLRPDGEQDGQSRSAEVEQAAAANGMTFAFVPVPHGDIPDSQVDSLALSLDFAQKPVVLYCRSGRRAARTWALSEASRPGGLDANAIRRALDSAAQSSPDLDLAIESRIAARNPVQ